MNPTAESIREAGKAIVRPIVTVAVVVAVLLIGGLIAYDIGTDNADQVLDCAGAEDRQGALVLTIERSDFDEFNNGTTTLRVGDCSRLDYKTLTATLDALVGPGAGDESDVEPQPKARVEPADSKEQESNGDEGASDSEEASSSG